MYVTSRMPLELAILFIIPKKKILPGMRTELSSGFFQYGYVLCYLWRLNSNVLW